MPKYIAPMVVALCFAGGVLGLCIIVGIVITDIAQDGKL